MRFITYRGFSLIEILVVVAIIALLASVVGPNLIGKLGSTKSKTARLQIDNIGAALDLYYLEIGEYPSSTQGLRALVEKPSDVEDWNGPYLKKSKLPSDPWKRTYQYVSPGRYGAYDLWTFGADGTAGGEDEEADVTNWQ